MTDRQLLQRLRARDQEALAQLQERYHGYLTTVITAILGKAGTSADAEELCNDTFLWLRKRGELEMDLDEIDLPDQSDSLEEQTIQKELAATVRKAVDSMPRREREVFLRYYYYLQPGDEISREMGIPASTVRTILARGRNTLRKKLSKEVSL